MEGALCAIQVLGYVKGVGKGAFVALAADLDARVKLSALADGFVEDPAVAFPEGRLVRGRVTAIDGSRYARHTALIGYASMMNSASSRSVFAAECNSRRG